VIGEAVLKSIPQHRMADPEEIANLILFLAAPESSFVTGSILDIDGGQLAASGICV
jgi:NAD(P)-dependent dehydrogenase (short-subunit alcohol dehydrogenase family)